MEIALNVLMVERKYSGKILQDTASTDENSEGLVCVEEIMPPKTMVLPNYIARLQAYTEKECRRICRQMAEIIKISHENGLAHRNIHMNNWLLDRHVRLLLCAFGSPRPCRSFVALLLRL